MPIVLALVALLIAFNWQPIVDKLSTAFTDALDFTILRPSNFKLAGGNINFDFNFSINNPTGLPIKLRNLLITVFYLQNGIYTPVVATSPTSIKDLDLSPGVSTYKINFSTPMVASVATIQSMITSKLVGTPLALRINAKANFLDLPPIDIDSDFTV